MTRPRLRMPAALLAAAALTALSACGDDASPPAGPSSPSITAPPSSSPPPSASPSASGRTLTETNLLTEADIPSPDSSLKIEEVAEGRGRSPEQISICFPGDADDLGATAMESRNFRFALVDPEDEEAPEEDEGGPGPDDPSIYTLVWQFENAAGAAQAQETIQGWVADCRKTLATSTQWRPIRADQKSSRFHSVKLSGAGQGAWAEVPLYRAKADRSDSGFFETVGLTLVQDRLMVTVDLVYGMDKITSDQQGGDPDNGVPADRQFDLVKAAAQRLAT